MRFFYILVFILLPVYLNSDENGKEKMRYLVRGGEDGQSFWYEPGLSSNKKDDEIFMVNDKSIALQFSGLCKLCYRYQIGKNDFHPSIHFLHLLLH